MSFIDPIVPEPEWGRPMPHLTDDDVYEMDEEDFDEDWEDDQCFECGEIGEDCTCEEEI